MEGHREMVSFATYLQCRVPAVSVGLRTWVGLLRFVRPSQRIAITVLRHPNRNSWWLTVFVNRSSVLSSTPSAVAFAATSNDLSTTFSCRVVDRAAAVLRGRAVSSVVVASVLTFCCSPCVDSFSNQDFSRSQRTENTTSPRVGLL